MATESSISPNAAAPWSLMAPEAGTGTKPPEQRTAATGRPDDKGPAVATGDDTLFGKDGFSFSDFLDVVNPLQHIPGVSTLYQELTGDRISPGARMAGGALFGGPLGFAGAIVNNAIEAHSGEDLGGNVLAMIQGDTAADTGTQMAQAQREAPQQAAAGAPGKSSPAGPEDRAGTASTVDNAGQTARAQHFLAQHQTASNRQDTDVPRNPAARGAIQAQDGIPILSAARAQGSPVASTKPVPPKGDGPEPAQAAATEPASATRKRQLNVSPDVARQLEKLATRSNTASAPPPETPMQDTARPRLSPDVARQLEALAQRSQQDPGLTAPRNPRPDPKPGGTVESRAAPDPGDQSKTPAPDRVKAAQTAYSDAQDSVSLDQVPDAMMSALKKYEAMLNNQG